jgi:hypothetical protein
MAPRKDYECASGRGRYASDHKTRANQCKPKKKIYVRKMVPGYVRKVRSDKNVKRGPRGARKDYTCVGGRGRYASDHKTRAGQCKPPPRDRLRDQPGYVRKVRSDKGLPRKAPMVTTRRKKR